VAPKIALQLIIGQNALFAFPGNGDGIGELGGLEVEVEVGPRPVTHRSRPELPTPILLCIPRTPAAAPEYLSRSLALVQWVFFAASSISTTTSDVPSFSHSFLDPIFPDAGDEVKRILIAENFPHDLCNLKSRLRMFCELSIATRTFIRLLAANYVAQLKDG